MREFLTAVGEHAFLQRALLAGLLASVACGVVGTYIVARRITAIAGAIAHSVLGGIGAARYLAAVRGWDGLSPLHGALAAALLSALIIGAVSLRAKEREDTVIGAVWAIGMAVGVVFLAKTPGYGEDLMSYLFGNILMVSPRDLRLIGALDVAVVVLGLAFYRQFQGICFDAEFAALRGVKVEVGYLLLLALTAVTVVLLATVVGIVMVIALVTLPVAIAGRFTRTLAQMMAGATIVSALLTTAGLAVSYGPDLPAGATIILLAGATYILVAAARALLDRRRRDAAA
jgi:zinc transport system permease protein